MGARSKIEWTDASWTPIRARRKQGGKIGWHCEHASEGCRNCYAEAMNKRLGTRLGTRLGFKPAGRTAMRDSRCHAAGARMSKIEITAALFHETAAAVCVSDTGDEKDAVWLPLAQIGLRVTTKRTKATLKSGAGITLPLVAIELPEWLAKNKGLV